MSWYKKSQAIDVCFYVDMDNTLLFSTTNISGIRGITDEELESDSNIVFEKRGFKKGLEVGGTAYWSKIRPGAIEFLSALKGIGKVYLCTSATNDYADAALRVLGIDGFFDGKYYRNNVYQDVVQNSCARFFLIDDLPFNTSGISQKMRFLGSGMNPEDQPWGDEDEMKEYEKKKARYESEYGPKHIQVKFFRGDDGDSDLSRVLSEIKKSLSASSNNMR